MDLAVGSTWNQKNVAFRRMRSKQWIPNDVWLVDRQKMQRPSCPLYAMLHPFDSTSSIYFAALRRHSSFKCVIILHVHSGWQFGRAKGNTSRVQHIIHHKILRSQNVPLRSSPSLSFRLSSQQLQLQRASVSKLLDNFLLYFVLLHKLLSSIFFLRLFCFVASE